MLSTESDKYAGLGSKSKMARTDINSDELFFLNPRNDYSDDPEPQRGEISSSGRPIEQFARDNGIPVSEIWRRIRNGGLIARPVNGSLYVFSDYSRPMVEPGLESTILNHREMHANATGQVEVSSAVMSALNVFSQEKSIASCGELPSLPPDTLESNTGEGVARTNKNSKGLVSFPEMALLLDHLSLAKEENKEIIKLTQDTIQRVTAMSENIVAMKNEIIEAKNAQIDILNDRLGEQASRIQNLNQEKEDLEMLTRLIGSE